MGQNPNLHKLSKSYWSHFFKIYPHSLVSLVLGKVNADLGINPQLVQRRAEHCMWGKREGDIKSWPYSPRASESFDIIHCLGSLHWQNLKRSACQTFAMTCSWYLQVQKGWDYYTRWVILENPQMTSRAFLVYCSDYAVPLARAGT